MQRDNLSINEINISVIDPLLLPWLQAVDEVTEGQLLEQLIMEHAGPLIELSVRRRRRILSYDAYGEDVNDIRNDLFLNVLTSLRDFKANPDQPPIRDFYQYVRGLCSSHIKKSQVQHSNDLPFDDYANAEEYYDQSEDTYITTIEALPAPETNDESGVVNPLLLQWLWVKMCELPLQQRTALLLNLRGIELISNLGIASIHQIAEVLKYPPVQFAKLWTKLPLNDEDIAEILGEKKPQVRQCRLMARKKLSRQISNLELQNEERLFIEIAASSLQAVGSIEKMAGAANILKSLPYKAESISEGWSEAQSHINTISRLSQDYLTRVTPAAQLKVLEELRKEITSFRLAMSLAKPIIAQCFKPLAHSWLQIVIHKGDEWLSFTPIPNPFVAGPPLHQRDHDLFMGRKDIIVAIEENIINPSQRPALLLYGRRRIGKTSTLLNLPRLLSSQFTPVFIDCQNAKWRDGDAAFCYHLAGSVYGELFQRNLLDGLTKPVLEQFEKYAFTRLDEFLDQVEALSRRINKQILLTFDEYERLEEGIAAQKITLEVLNQLRNIVQHRECIVVLFSGSHRFEELRVVNWSDYLINVKTLELSFLAPEDARELLTEPVPALHYEPGVVDAIVGLTHCQPYLLQAVASDLVNYLNAQKRQTATMNDLDVAVAKVLVTADAYFHNNWAECSDNEREALRALATDEAVSTQVEQYQTAWQSLSRKEIVEMRDDRYRFAVELFRLWILKNHLPAFSGKVFQRG